MSKQSKREAAYITAWPGECPPSIVGTRSTRADIDASMVRQGIPRLTDRQWQSLRQHEMRRRRLEAAREAAQAS